MESVIHAQGLLHLYTYIHIRHNQFSPQRKIQKDVTSLHRPETLFPALLRTKQKNVTLESAENLRISLAPHRPIDGQRSRNPKKVKYIKHSGLLSIYDRNKHERQQRG